MYNIYKFDHRQSELISKYNVGLKTLLQEGLSEPISDEGLFAKLFFFGTI